MMLFHPARLWAQQAGMQRAHRAGRARLQRPQRTLRATTGGSWVPHSSIGQPAAEQRRGADSTAGARVGSTAGARAGIGSSASRDRLGQRHARVSPVCPVAQVEIPAADLTRADPKQRVFAGSIVSVGGGAVLVPPGDYALAIPDRTVASSLQERPRSIRLAAGEERTITLRCRWVLRPLSLSMLRVAAPNRSGFPSSWCARNSSRADGA